MSLSNSSSKDDLFRRYLSGETLSVRDLIAVAEGFWPKASADRLLDKALDEPPKSPIAAPSVMATLLQSIREMLGSSNELSADDLEIFNAAREKRALALLSIDSLTRETRLLKAYSVVLDHAPKDTVQRVDTVKIIAELGYRLIVEFEHSEMLALCATAYLWLSRHDPVRPNLRELSRHYEMRLRQLRISAAEGKGASTADLEAGWRKLQDEAREACKENEKASLDLAPTPKWYGATRRALLSVLMSDPQDMERAACAAVTGFEEITSRRTVASVPDPGVTSIKIKNNRDILEELIIGALTLLRLKSAMGRADQSADRSMLFTLLRALRFHDYTHDERAREFVRQGGLAGAAQALKRSLAPAAAQTAAREPIVLNETILREHVDELLRVPRRFGLALSGGGFRAAFFHLGVLARLAETDQLRHLALVSCVSGGSIAGAGFAIRLKALLQEKFDLDIQVEDYVQLVQDVMERLLAIGHANLRMRALANPLAVLRMWLQPNYTFTVRIAELLDRSFFAPLHPQVAKLSRRELRRITRAKSEMTRPGAIGAVETSLAKTPKLGWPVGPWDLLYAPRGEPKRVRAAAGDNVLRRATVPEFVFNATALNTGNAFRFSSEGLGEQLNASTAEISQRPRLAWLEYDDLTVGAGLEPQRLPLSRVVSASASVPGIIPPVIVERNAKDLLIALADGGVVDNQGADHLLEQRCTHVLISDASGQLRYQSYPDVTNMPVMARSSDILMERIRELNYAHAKKDMGTGVINQLTYLHLTSELSQPPPPSDFRPQDVLANILYPRDQESLSSYGIKKRLQGSLARMRTDLDCFSEVEAYSLMLSGYSQAAQFVAGTPAPSRSPPHWAFLAMTESLGGGSRGDHTGVLLDIGQHRFLRLPRILIARVQELSVPMRLCVAVACIAVLALAAGALLTHMRVLIRQLLANTTITGCLWAGVVVVAFALRFPPSPLKRWLVKIAAAPLLIGGMILAWGALLVADPLYLKLCKVRPVAGRDASRSRGGGDRTQISAEGGSL